MKKFFYTNGIDKIGPFTFDELKKQNLTRDTKVWFYGLDNWKPLSEVEELSSLTNSIPPPLKLSNSHISSKEKEFPEYAIGTKKSKERSLKNLSLLLLSSTIIILISFILIKGHAKSKLYSNIAASAYDTDVDFNFYVEKFYRDIGNYGIFPKKPQTQIIKFAKLDQLDDATHIHGISYGKDDDDRIEIYINPTTWKKFNKPMRYFLLYHELSHDVLNLDDLKELPINEGKLMYPALANYESKSMDDFIESSHKLFEEINLKQKK